ncbi:Uncharacterised protein [Salmonella enterica subsp. enterica serovar Bovismorbificans]|uniref:Uncharacterized protein n=1 Tax=Salmonella enterica subsp. enterica serovar Bovismorbificans TaxID=58097 RepID=A0A655DWL7_SALET|nr:Uncharacterised protein [Salmonella enterica subsp. enterica serovar Bovismorbificans]
MPLLRQIVADTVRQLRFAKGVSLRDHPLPRQFRQTRDLYTPRFTFFRRMQFQPVGDFRYQSASTMVRRVQTTFNIVDYPVLFRLAGCLPLQ